MESSPSAMYSSPGTIAATSLLFCCHITSNCLTHAESTTTTPQAPCGKEDLVAFIIAGMGGFVLLSAVIGFTVIFICIRRSRRNLPDDTEGTTTTGTNVDEESEHSETTQTTTPAGVKHRDEENDSDKPAKMPVHEESVREEDKS